MEETWWKVTSVDLQMETKGSLCATATIVIDHQFVVRGFKVIRDESGAYRLQLPSDKPPPPGSPGAIPSFRAHVEESILDAFHRALEKQGGEP